MGSVGVIGLHGPLLAVAAQGHLRGDVPGAPLLHRRRPLAHDMVNGSTLYAPHRDHDRLVGPGGVDVPHLYALSHPPLRSLAPTSSGIQEVASEGEAT